MSFEELSLSAPLLKAITQKGYETPTPIQAQTIPIILQGQDLMGKAQTGTGKTAGFTLPLLHILDANPSQGKKQVRALILVPTRELAVQVEQSVKDYGKYLPLSSTVVFGGVNIMSQINRLRKGVDILIATPGRLIDLVKQRKVDLSFVELFVLDEADRLLDMGFIEDIRRIMGMLPKKRQSLLFSATFTKKVNQLADQILNSPQKVEIKTTNTISDRIEQSIISIDRSKKTKAIRHLINSQRLNQVLIFTRTKRSADRLARDLKDQNISAKTFHGDMDQKARQRALTSFKMGQTQALVATDVASRGIDIDQLSHVINFELPTCAEDYVHRIGRTGRAGASGQAISLVSFDEAKLFEAIKRLLKSELPIQTLPDFEPSQKLELAKPEPKKKAFKRGRAFRHKKPRAFSKRRRPFKRRAAAA